MVVVDATQLLRNLYLVLQILELGLPTLIALNMSDTLADRGIEIDTAALAECLGAPVVQTSARTGEGLDDLRDALSRTLEGDVARASTPWFEDDPAGDDVAAVCEAVPAEWAQAHGQREALARWALLSVAADDELEDVPTELRAKVEDSARLCPRQAIQIEG